MTYRPQNALLLEIMLSILIFALVSTCLLKVFYAVHENAREAEIKNEALIVMKDLSEALYANEDHAALLIKEGFLKAGDGYEKEYNGFMLSVKPYASDTPEGVMMSADIAFIIGSRREAAFTVRRYYPGEAVP